MTIELTMRVRLDGTKRPICLDCEHSVMSHGERDGALFCWACAGLGQECGAVLQPVKPQQNSMCVK